MVSHLTSSVPGWWQRHTLATDEANPHLTMPQVLGFAAAFCLVAHQCDCVGLGKPFYPGSFSSVQALTLPRGSFEATSVLSNMGDQSFFLFLNPHAVSFPDFLCPTLSLKVFFAVFLCVPLPSCPHDVAHLDLAVFFTFRTRPLWGAPRATLRGNLKSWTSPPPYIS